MIKMNEEDKMPTYGKLYAENFRLEHNYRVVSEREAKLQNNWNELKDRTQKKIEQLEYFNEQLKTSPYTPQIETLKLTLKDMQELEQGKDERNN